MSDEHLRPWTELPLDEQLRLREEYGYYLDSQPPSCSLETKIERFQAWLAERGICYRHPS